MRSAAARELQSKDLRRLLDLAHLLGEDDHEEEFPDTALETMAAVVGCDILSYDRVDLVARRITSHRHLPAAVEISSTPGFDHALSQHPGFGIAGHARARDGAVALSDLLTVRDMRRLALYTDYHRPHGVEDQLFGIIRRDRRHPTVLLVSRDRRGFSRRDRAVVELMSRSLRQRINRHHRKNALAAMHRRVAQLSDVLPRIGTLTRRERQVLDNLLLGASNRELARTLALSQRTIEKHLEHLYRKLGVTNRAHVIALATRHLTGTAKSPESWF